MPTLSRVSTDLDLLAEGRSANVAGTSEHRKAEGKAEPIDPATTRLRGSINYDRENGHDTEWESMEEFHQWRENEERAHGIELRLAHTVSSNGSAVYTASQLWVCSRQGTGGEKNYKRTTERKSRVERKRLGEGCPCQVRIKIYPHTPMILGKYSPEHSHQTGKSNLKHVRIRVPAREHIMELIRLGLMDKEIKKRMRAQYSEHERDHYITLEQIGRIRKIVHREFVQLDPNDAHSICLWAEQIQSRGDLAYYKDKSDPPPEGSNLACSVFMLCIQTRFQMESFRCLGDAFMGIDATHNVTGYTGLQLFTIMVRDHWGHGVPVAWMLSSSGTQTTISYFMNLIKARSPCVSPSIYMTDRDLAQVNAIREIYPSSRIFYCWWHVLRAIRSHFVVTEFPDLWSLIQKWVRTNDQYEFDAWWEDIQNDHTVPQSLAEYLAREWISCKEMWSGVFRQNRSIFQEGDTNMLLEAYHHVLKSKWLDGKHNRRIDDLIYVLLTDLLPEMEDRHKRQELGMEGSNLAKERTNEILTRAPEFPQDRIEQVDEERFLVRSSNQEKFYNVGFKDCDCKDFPRVKLCKHVAAVQHYFGGKHSAPPTQPGPTAPDSQETASAAAITPGNTNQENAAHHSALLIAAANDLITLSRQLLTQAPSATPELVKSVHSVRSHLSVVASATGDSQLPEKEAIAPNQLSWPETAKRMGVKWGGKRKGKVNGALSAQLIGELNRKWNRTDQDPYGGGEHSGKRARPDARSVVANTRARAAAEPAKEPAPVPPLPASAPLPSLPASAPPPSSRAVPMDNMPRFTPAQPFSLSQPAPASFNYIPQPYMHYPYPVPMYYPPPT